MSRTLHTTTILFVVILLAHVTGAHRLLDSINSNSNKTFAGKTSVVKLSHQASYLYVHDNIALLCPYSGSNNFMYLVNLTSQTSMPRITYPAATNTGNHMCYLELGVGKKAPLQVYQSTTTVGVVGYSVASQSQVWTNSAPGNNAFGPCFNKHRDEVYVTSADGSLFCIDATSGASKWNLTYSSSSSATTFAYRPTLLGHATVVLATTDGDLVAYDVSSGKPDSHSWRMRKAHVFQADKLEIIEGGFGNAYMRTRGDTSGSANLVKFDYTMGIVGWTRQLHDQSAISQGQYPNTVAFCATDFELWAAYNGSNIARIGRENGGLRSVTPFPDGHTVAQGMVGFGKNHIATILGSGQQLYVFAELDGRFAGKMRLPPASGTSIYGTLNWFDSVGDARIVAVSNDPAVVTVATNSSNIRA